MVQQLRLVPWPAWSSTGSIRADVIPARQPPAEGSRKAAISSLLRASKRSPASASWFHVLPSIAGNRESSAHRSWLASTSASAPLFQEDELAVAVASALPLALAAVEFDTREDSAVEAEGVALVDHEVEKKGLSPSEVQRSSARHLPGPWATTRRRMPRPAPLEQRSTGLAAGLETGPFVLPEQSAVGRSDAGQAGSGGGEVVGGDPAGDDDLVADHQWRVGVPRGPAPDPGSENRAASPCLHTDSPVAAS